MSNHTTNISIKANIWTDEYSQSVDNPQAIQHAIPGDLMVEMLGTRDLRILRQKMSDKQLEEYRHCRFFQFHGETGMAYDH
jgi:hypothetical protein